MLQKERHKKSQNLSEEEKGKKRQYHCDQRIFLKKKKKESWIYKNFYLVHKK